MLLNLFEFFCCLVVDCQSMQKLSGTVYRQFGIKGFPCFILWDNRNRIYPKDPAGKVQLLCKIHQRLTRYSRGIADCIDTQKIVPPHTGKLNIWEAGCEQSLHLVQVDPIAKEFDESLFASHDVIETVSIPVCHVSGAQETAPFIALGKVFGTLGITHGHIISTIDKLTCGIRGFDLGAVSVFQPE